MKRKGLKRIIVLVIISILWMSLVGCGIRKEASDESRTELSQSKSKAIAPEEMKDASSSDYGESAQDGDYANGTDSNRKIIQTKYYIIETLEFDKISPEVETLVNKHSGYIENSQVSGRTLYYDDYYSTRTAYYTMRVPAEILNQFSNELESLGNVIEKSTSKEDVTTQLIDVEARIKSLEVQEARLLELVKTGGQLKDILEIETQLSDVRYQIETFKASMTNLEKQVSYSTVQLELREVVKETDKVKPAFTIGERISQGFTHSLNNIKEFFVNLFVLIIVALPYLILWALFILIIVIIIKRALRKNKSKKETKTVTEVEVPNISEQDKK